MKKKDGFGTKARTCQLSGKLLLAFTFQHATKCKIIFAEVEESKRMVFEPILTTCMGGSSISVCLLSPIGDLNTVHSQRRY